MHFGQYIERHFSENFHPLSAKLKEEVHPTFKTMLLLSCLFLCFLTAPFHSYSQSKGDSDKVMGKFANQYFAKGDSLLQENDIVNAMIFFTEALDIYEYIYGSHNPRMIGIYNILGRLLADEGFINEAIPVVEKALQNLALQPKTVPRISADLYLLMGRLYQQKGLGTAALPYFLQTLKLYIQHADLAAPEDILLLRMETGNLYLEQKKFGEAKIAYQQALAYLLKFTPELNQNVAFIHRYLGMIYLQSDSTEQALYHLHKSLKLTRTIFTEASEEAANAYTSLSALHFRSGQFDSASVYADRVIDAYRKMEGNHEKELSEYQLFLSRQYFLAQAYTTSAIWYKRYFALKTTLVEDSLSQANLTLQCVDVADKFAQSMIYYEAFKFYELAYHFYSDYFGERDPQTVRFLLSLSSIYKEIGDWERAQDRLEKALLLQKAQDRPDTIRMRQTFINLAKLHAAKQEFDLSNDRYFSALKLLPIMNNQKAGVFHQLAQNYYQLAQYDSAMRYAQLEAGFYREIYDGVHINMATSYLLLGSIHHAMSNKQEAMEFFAQGMSQDPEALLEADWVSMEANRLLSEIYRDIGKPEKSKWHAARAHEIKMKLQR